MATALLPPGPVDRGVRADADSVQIGEIVAPAAPGSPIGIYVHVPFCAHVCPYCDFNTYAGQSALIPRYVSALEREIAAYGEALVGREAETLFFGGGTPSLLSVGDVGRLIRAYRNAFDLAPDAEVTLEANPNGIEEAYCTGLLEAGVNRLSVGLQTLQRRGLRVLGRLHEAHDSQTAVAAARAAGFANVSLDLIFGWPGQTVAAWEADLDAVLNGEVGGSVPDHLSLYGLIVEPGTPLADAVARNILSIPDDDASADLYETATARMAAAGFVHYEIANWARDGSLASRHNLIYWRNGEYVGVGAGAHGHISGRRTMNHPLPARYCLAVERGEPAVANSETIGPDTARGETMMLGLRLLRDGISGTAFRARHGCELNEVYGDTIAHLVEQGLLDWSDDRVRLRTRGVMLANDVCERFV